MGKSAVSIVLSESERSGLVALSWARKTSQGPALRARIVLAAAKGLENKAICAELKVVPNTVGKWCKRFAQMRLDGLYDEPRPGAPRYAQGLRASPLGEGFVPNRGGPFCTPIRGPG